MNYRIRKITNNSCLNRNMKVLQFFHFLFSEGSYTWILLYNCGNPRGINMRTSEYPRGPWSEPQVLFHPWDDNGYCHFLHTSWEFQQCDSIHDNGRQNEWGGEYGPYQFEHFATGDSLSTTIYFTMSTWNPYTVVLMRAKLEKIK